PTVYHMNEGHSAFLALERIRLLMGRHGLSFEESLESCRVNNVFTTHTSVPAGIDLFDPGLMYEYFHRYCEQENIPFEKLLALGRHNPHDSHERFSMAICALKTSALRNAVSRLHREVSQEMWQSLWPQLPTWEVPITSITNGIHLPTWLNADLGALYDQHLQPDWRERYQDPKTWELIHEVPDADLWEAHKRRKRKLISFVRQRLVASATLRKAPSAELRRLDGVLDPETLTIGFARRFATYKRATLLFRDVARLKKICANPAMPVQIVIAGKAHPKDHPGKALIRDIWQWSRDPELANRLVFVEDYDLEVGRELVRGVDLWLNNPRRGEEACGTSGMKAAINGVLSLSILDGWFDEAYEISGGWAIGDRDPYAEDQDEIHASSIYSLLENEIAPLFYQARDEGVPVEWMGRVKQCLANISPRFNCLRMLREYTAQLYEPAHQAWLDVAAKQFQPVRDRTRWMDQVREAWEMIRVVDSGPPATTPLVSGRAIPLRAVVDLAGLTPGDVRVEAVVGRVSVNGNLEETTVITLTPTEREGAAYVFAREFIPHHTGRLGYSLRISPNHCEDPLTRQCHPYLKWA
ncbi:MAG: alpha-glucan family phosphorylase, partial [Bryobacteraceae bacterium]